MAKKPTDDFLELFIEFIQSAPPDAAAYLMADYEASSYEPDPLEYGTIDTEPFFAETTYKRTMDYLRDELGDMMYEEVKT